MVLPIPSISTIPRRNSMFEETRQYHTFCSTVSVKNCTIDTLQHAASFCFPVIFLDGATPIFITSSFRYTVKDEADEDDQTAPQKTAIISVYDKTGLLDLAKGLVKNNVRILASGGTARTIRDANFPVESVTWLTNCAFHALINSQ